MKEFLLTATYLVGLGELILAGYFWKTHSGNEIRKVMAFLSLSTAGWTISNTYVAQFISEPVVTFELRVIHFFGIYIVSTLLHLSIIFPFKKRIFDGLHTLLFYVPSIIISYIIFFTNAITLGYVPQYLSGKTIGGSLFDLYNIYLTIYYFVAVIILFTKLKRSDGINRSNTILFLYAVLISGIPAMVFNVWYALVDQVPSALVGPLVSSIWLGITAYILIRKV